MIDTGRFFMLVSTVFCAATVAAAFTEPGAPAHLGSAVLSVPASTPAALPVSELPPSDLVPPPEAVASSSIAVPDEVLVTVEAPSPPEPTVPPPAVSVPQRTPPVEQLVAVAQPDADLRELASLLHEATNRARKAQGLPPLGYDTTLAANAAAYSARMQREDFLGHTDPQGCALTCRFKESGYEALAWGENLARWRSSYEPDVNELATYFMREWLRSDGHRDNILSPDFTVQGIGYAIDGGEVFVTVHFADPS